MTKAQAISEAKLQAKVGRTLDVIVDEVDQDAATCRTMAEPLKSMATYSLTKAIRI